MGGHGGLNILPQKSWNVYGQRNRQKVAEDEEAHREKEEAEQKQRSKGDREIRLQVLRRQAGVEDDTKDDQEDLEESQDDVQDGPVFEEGPAEPADKQHVNFWSSFEKSARNPEREAEKKQTARKRGDPKTQTSDARFDEQFALMHGLAGQAPWYARPQQSMYATNTVQSSDAHASVAQAGLALSHQRHDAGNHRRAEPRGGRDQHRAHRGGRHGAREKKDPHQYASFDMAAGQSDLAAMVGQGNPAQDVRLDQRPKDKEKLHTHKHKSKHRGDSDGKSSGHRKRERAERSRSPKANHKRSKSRRRDNSSSSSSGSDDDRGGAGRRDAGRKSSPVVKAPSTSTKDKFEHLRRERLERERAEAQRTRSLLQQHFSR